MRTGNDRIDAELIEGTERGAGLIEVHNASGLSFSVLPGRAL